MRDVERRRHASGTRRLRPARVAWLQAVLVIALQTGLALAAGSSPAQAAPPGGVDPRKGMLAEAAQAVGMKRCKAVAERLSVLASAGATAEDMLVDWDRSRPDGPAFVAVGTQYLDASAALLLAAFPEEDGSCTFASERIAMAPLQCAAVAELELKGMRAHRLLDRLTVYVDAAEPAATVMLLDSAPGCLVLRRHVEFRWRPPTK